MKIHRLFLTVIISVLITIPVSAQKKHRKSKADVLFESGEYQKALERYKKDYSKKKKNKAKKAEIVFKLGECNRHLNIPKKAEKWYKRAVKLKYPNPKATLYLADVYRMNEKYEEALEQYQKYRDLVPDDPRGEIGELSCDSILVWLDKPTHYIVENMKEFNSKQSDL